MAVILGSLAGLAAAFTAKPRPAAPSGSPVWVLSAALLAALCPTAPLERVLAANEIARLSAPPNPGRLIPYLDTAAANAIPAPPSTLRSTLASLIAQSENADAGNVPWRAATALVNYRWEAMPAPMPPPPPGAVWRPSDLARWGTLQFDVLVPPAGTNSPTRFAHARRPGLLPLDGLQLRDTALLRIPVFYNGGPLSLDRVTFNHCRIRIQNTPSGRAFASALLAPVVNFHVPPK